MLGLFSQWVHFFLAAGTPRTRGLLERALLDADVGAVEGLDETHALPSGVAGVHPSDLPAHVLEEAAVASPVIAQGARCVSASGNLSF